jgi:hypothetical protein
MFLFFVASCVGKCTLLDLLDPNARTKWARYKH